jgi:hypothetical protein
MKTRPAFLLLLVLWMLACNLGQLPAEQPAHGLPPSTEAMPANSVPAAALPPPADPGAVIQPGDLTYLGAFRLPGGDEPPRTFAYGGNAMTFNPEGDPRGGEDGFPGSLFIMGHDRVAYGSLPDGGQVAEVSIPAPIPSKNVEDLNTAEFIQDFANLFENRFVEFQEIPKAGMQYLNRPETGTQIHVTWGEHLQRDEFPSHGWFSPNLSAPDFRGEWFIGSVNMYSVNAYMFEIPTAWAEAYAGGRYLATGRMRDGGQGGMGPTIFAYRPWTADGSPPPSGTRLEEVALLLYENAYNSADIVRAMNGYQHPDAWEGGAWLTTSSGKQAVLFAGTKSTGEKYWYGYINAAGPQYACVDVHVTDFITCRMADGSPCPPEDFNGCCDEESAIPCASSRGWWSTRFDAQFILFDPNQLAQVAAGQLEAWQPQPYAMIDIDEHLFFNPPEWDAVTLGFGDQRRDRIGDISYDRANGLLYVLELYGDGGKPMVHVWRILDLP